MSSRSLVVGTKRYELVSSGDCVVYNQSQYPIRVFYDTQQPSPDVQGYFEVEPDGDTSKVNNFPEGNVYVRCGAPDSNFERSSEVRVTFGSPTNSEQFAQLLLVNAAILEELKEITFLLGALSE